MSDKEYLETLDDAIFLHEDGSLHLKKYTTPMPDMIIKHLVVDGNMHGIFRSLRVPTDLIDQCVELLRNKQSGCKNRSTHIESDGNKIKQIDTRFS